MSKQRIQLTIPNSRNGKLYVSDGKPPKLRFRPGWYVEYEGQLYVIQYAFRVQEVPHEWHFCLEERAQLHAPNETMMDALCALIEERQDPVPRIVYSIFRNSWDAMQYFVSIPCSGDRVTITNKKLLNRGRVVSKHDIQTT